MVRASGIGTGPKRKSIHTRISFLRFLSFSSRSSGEIEVSQTGRWPVQSWQTRQYNAELAELLVSACLQFFIANIIFLLITALASSPRCAATQLLSMTSIRALGSIRTKVLGSRRNRPLTASESVRRRASSRIAG